MIFDFRAFLREIGQCDTENTCVDNNSHFVSFSSPIASAISEELIINGLEKFGFTATHRSSEPFLTRISGSRNNEHLTICLINSRGIIQIKGDWKDTTIRPISSPTFHWKDREWPIYFQEASIYHMSSDILIIEGQGEKNEYLKNYQVWAEQNNYQIGPRDTDVEYHEPDLQSELHFYDEEFIVKVDPREPFVLLFVQKRVHE